jgi:hypothetical protein
MKGVCEDGPAQGYAREGLSSPPPKTLRVEDVVEEDRVWEQEDNDTEVEFGRWGYRLDRVELSEAVGQPATRIPVAVYKYDASLDPKAAEVDTP